MRGYTLLRNVPLKTAFSTPVRRRKSGPRLSDKSKLLMALYRLEAKVISRAGGRSAVASAAYRTGKCATSAAAYRAGAKLTDERTGQAYDYTNKGGVAGAEILVPEGAPAWMQDRERLWNAVEIAEKRKDAQLARDFIISLPHELTAEQRVDLTREFVREQFTARGYVADIAWHSPDRTDSLNHHAHVMVPMRKIEGDGFAARKERPPNGEHPAKAWKDELGRLREAWADTANKHLDAAGLDIRVDHRSLEARGLEREPEPKVGPLAMQIERDGRESLAGNERRVVKARNAERQGVRAELAQAITQRAALVVVSQPVEPRDEKPRAPMTVPGLEWTDRAGMVAQQESAMKAARDRAVRPVDPKKPERSPPAIPASTAPAKKQPEAPDRQEPDLLAAFSTAEIRNKAAEEEARRANDPARTNDRGRGGRTR